MSLDQPDKPILPYNIAMLVGLLFRPNPIRLLNLGAGGNTFERFFHAHLPALSVTSVDADSEVIKLANHYFPAPTGHLVHCQTAEEFLLNSNSRYDIVLCDIFNQQGHPECIGRADFYDKLQHSITTEGVLVLNLLPDTEQQVVEILLEIRIHFPWVQLLNLPDFKNILLFCTKQPAPYPSILRERAVSHSNRWNVDLHALTELLQEIPRALY